MKPEAVPASSQSIALTGLLALAVAMGIGRFAFTPLLPLMQGDGLLSIDEGGWMASVHFLGYLLGALYAARLPFSPRLTLRLSLLAIALSTIGMGLTSNLYVWFALRWIAGFCSALTLVLVSNYYVKHLAQAVHSRLQGWVFAGVGAGIATAGLGTLVIMVVAIESPTSWLLFGVASLAVTAVLWARMGAEITDTPATGNKGASKATPLIWHIIIPYGALGMGYVIPATYLPVMAREIIASPLTFGWAWPVFGAAAFASTLLAARIPQRFSIRQVWGVSQCIMAVGLLLPVVYPHITTIIAAGIFVGGTFMVITMMGMKETHRIAPSTDIMRHLAVMTAAFAVGQMIGPLFAGTIYAITGSFSAALILASVILLATTGLLAVTPQLNSGQA